MAINRSLISNQDRWNKLEETIVERILARLPVADFLRSQFVCQNWASVICSPSFPKAAKKLFNRLPWFLMLSSQFPTNVVYDMEVDGWCHIPLLAPREARIRPVPVAASNSFICCISADGIIYVCNPMNGSVRYIGVVLGVLFLKAIVMHAEGSDYTLYLVFWSQGGLYMQMFISAFDDWVDFPLELFREDYVEGNSLTKVKVLNPEQLFTPTYGVNLSCMRTKEIIGVVARNGYEYVVVYYLEPSGRLVACDPYERTAVVFPPILLGNQYAIALAECHDRVLIFVLMEEHENMVLRVWEFDRTEQQWSNIATMPSEISKGYNGVNPDVSCTGGGDYVMVCVSSVEYNFTKVAVFNIVENTWKELPTCMDPRCGQPKRFVSAFSFMPDIGDNA